MKKRFRKKLYAECRYRESIGLEFDKTFACTLRHAKIDERSSLYLNLRASTVLIYSGSAYADIESFAMFSNTLLEIKIRTFELYKKISNFKSS